MSSSSGSPVAGGSGGGGSASDSPKPTFFTGYHEALDKWDWLLDNCSYPQNILWTTGRDVGPDLTAALVDDLHSFLKLPADSWEAWQGSEQACALGRALCRLRLAHQWGTAARDPHDHSIRVCCEHIAKAVADLHLAETGTRLTEQPSIQAKMDLRWAQACITRYLFTLEASWGNQSHCVQAVRAVLGDLGLLERPQIERSVSIRVFTSEIDGAVYDLELELLRVSGVQHSHLFQDPTTLGVVTLIKGFRESIGDAWTCTDKLFNRGACVRWRLKPFKAERLRTLEGPSAGAAFAIGLALLASGSPTESIGASGEIMPDGNLRPIGGLGEKLRAAADEAQAFGVRRLVIVAQDQLDVPSELELIPTREHLPVNQSRYLQVVRARNVKQAVDLIRELQGPRADVRDAHRQRCAQIEILKRRRVPMETHFQLLPMLHKLPPEKLKELAARDDSRGRDGDDHGYRGLRASDLRRWEETVLHDKYGEPQALQEIICDFSNAAVQSGASVPRCIVLGSPGNGKTTLLRFLAWVCSQADGYDAVSAPDVSERESAIGRIRSHMSRRSWVPALVGLAEWRRAGNGCLDLPMYLASRYRAESVPVKEMIELWSDWLNAGQVLLLLDGLDEVCQRFAMDRLSKAVERFGNCPLILTCRTIGFKEYTFTWEELPVFLLDALSTEQRNTSIHSFPVQYRERYSPRDLIEQLDRTPQMAAMAHSPLLLSLICYLVDDPKGIMLPATRGELYQQVIDKLLREGGRRDDITYPGEPPAEGQLRAVLAGAALALFGQAQRELTFNEEALVAAFERSFPEHGFTTNAGAYTASFIAHLKDVGLVQEISANTYTFLHLTIQEFLAAQAIADVINGSNGWESKISLDGHAVTARLLVDRKAWDPAWEEVITLLAGRLNDPNPLLDMLCEFIATETNPHGDDLFRHRLALAARCLPEIKRVELDQARLRAITSEVFELCMHHWRAGTEKAAVQLTDSLLPLALINGPVGERHQARTLLETLVERGLHDPDVWIPSRAAAALGQLSTAVCAAEAPIKNGILEALVHGCRKGYSGAAVTALGRLSAAVCAAEAPVRRRVLRALRLYGAQEALGRCDAAASPGAQPVVDQVLEELLGESLIIGSANPFIVWRFRATEALRALAAAYSGANTSIRSRIVGALVDRGLNAEIEEVRLRAAEALGRLAETVGAAEATVRDRTLEALVDRLVSDDDRPVRLTAADTLGRLSVAVGGAEASVRVRVLEELLNHCMNVEAGWVGSSAAEALGRLATEVSLSGVLLHNRIMGVLIERCRRNHSTGVELARVAAAHHSIGVGARELVLEILIDHCMNRDDGHSRGYAAEALGHLAVPDWAAQASVRNRVFEALVDRGLKDSDYYVRDCAAEALERWAAVACTVDAPIRNRIMEALVDRCLNDADYWVRSSAASALGHIVITPCGAEALLRERVVEALVDRCLNSDAGWMRSVAAESLGHLGPVILLGDTSIRNQVLEALLHLYLNDDDDEFNILCPVRENAGTALGNLRFLVVAAEKSVRNRILEALVDRCLNHTEKWQRPEAATLIGTVLGLDLRAFPVPLEGFDVKTMDELSSLDR